jgi:hypothetical protein
MTDKRGVGGGEAGAITGTAVTGFGFEPLRIKRATPVGGWGVVSVDQLSHMTEAERSAPVVAPAVVVVQPRVEPVVARPRPVTARVRPQAARWRDVLISPVTVMACFCGALVGGLVVWGLGTAKVPAPPRAIPLPAAPRVAEPTPPAAPVAAPPAPVVPAEEPAAPAVQAAEEPAAPAVQVAEEPEPLPEAAPRPQPPEPQQAEPAPAVAAPARLADRRAPIARSARTAAALSRRRASARSAAPTETAPQQPSTEEQQAAAPARETWVDPFSDSSWMKLPVKN